MRRGRPIQSARARGKHDYRRAVATRTDIPRILIVTEGGETEPKYLNELIKRERLSPANVVVDGACGSDPMSVYRHAKKLYTAEKRQGEEFDRVYCVFDKDDHSNYVDALDAISRAVPVSVFRAINSVPCFEYWVLLHFQYTTKAYQAPGGQSSCELLVKEIKSLIPGYQKGQNGLYRLLEDKTANATMHAKRSLAAAEAAGTDNPTTRMHLLVEYLFKLKK